MKKLLCSTIASIVVFSSAAALAAPNQNNMAPNKMDGNFTPTVETITARAEQRLAGNPNLKLDSVTEADGKFTVRIVTKDGSLVEEKIIDPAQRGQGHGMMNNDAPLTVERTKEILEGKLAMRGNPNIKLGEVTEADGKIKATIVTQDGSLVHELDIDPTQPFMAFHGLMSMDEGGMKAHGMMGEGDRGDKMMGRGDKGQGHGFHHSKERGGKMGMNQGQGMDNMPCQNPGQTMMDKGMQQGQAPKQ